MRYTYPQEHNIHIDARERRKKGGDSNTNIQTKITDQINIQQSLEEEGNEKVSNMHKDVRKLNNDSALTKKKQTSKKIKNLRQSPIKEEKKRSIVEQEQVYKDIKMNTVNHTIKSRINKVPKKHKK